MQELTELWVTKRNGRIEPLDLEKIHRVVSWASEHLNNVSISQVELQAQIQFYDRIPTETIHAMLIKAAADLISEEAPDYQFLAARLSLFSLRKKAFGTFTPPHLWDHVCAMVKKNRYDRELLKHYSQEEFMAMDQFLENHRRDLNFSYAAIKQFEGKYLVQDRTAGRLYETPQFLYILVAATLFSRENPTIRLQKVREFYDAISMFKLSLPTPIMAGVRTPTRQYSSCVLIDCADSLDSINATANAIVSYVSKRAGIGINAGAIRAVGSAVRGGEIFHTGCIPFYKYFQAAVKSCSQGGVRGGAATLFFPLWHLEAEHLLVLKNNRGIEENRARHMDYGVQLNRVMYQKLRDGGNITLFSPHDVPDLYDAFFQDTDRFETLYEAYAHNPNIRKKTISAISLFSLLAQERASTGRLYIQHVDHCNTHSAFNAALAPIRQSNLCMEVTLPTKPISHASRDDGEIALCTLGAFNLGELKNLEELEPLAHLLVRALDALLDYQEYTLNSAKEATLNRRPLGIGVINYAYYLAKAGVKYSDGSANALTHRTFEALQFYLLKASCALAKEKGPCPKFNETTYAQGLLPIDTYKKRLDSVCLVPLERDWETLRKEILTYGLRHSTLSCQMPSETSSQISNATNGIEPPRGYITVKASKDGVLRQVIPEYQSLHHQYELLWDAPNCHGYLTLAAIMQKFIDQAISVNTFYDPLKFSSKKVPVKQILQDIMLAYQLGIKTLYYHNTRDGMSDPNQKEPVKEDALSSEGQCSSGACAI